MHSAFSFIAFRTILLALLPALLSLQAQTSPVNPLPVPEYHASESVIIRYDFNPNTWHIYEELIRHCQDAAHAYLLVNNNTEKQNLETLLLTAEIPMDNITLLMIPANRMWVRDHGPIAFSTDTGTAIAQFMDYNNSGFHDQNLPSSLANYWGYQHYNANFILDGGNFMVDSYGRLFSTTRLYTNNASLDPSVIDDFLMNTMGVSEIITVNPQHDDYWGHIDMQMKLLNDTTLVISSVDPWSGNNYQILEANVAIMESLTAPNGNPYHIARLPKADNWKTYANALILNQKVIVPIYGHPNDQIAINTYRSLMPDHEVVGINSNAIIGWGGAIHCITMQVFEWEPPVFQLSIDIQGLGMVTVNDHEYQGTVSFVQQDTILLRAFPAEGFVFEGWYGDFISTQDVIEIAVADDMVIGAKFRRLAENYVSFLPERQATLYDPQTQHVRFAKILRDSIFDQGRALFFAPNQVIEINDPCIVVEPSVFGHKVLLLNNGTEVYFNLHNDSIVINTLAVAGETWRVFSKNDLIIIGEVISHQPETFLEITDSVKTVTFQAYNNTMEPIAHTINGKNLKISKNHGVVSAIHFYGFPEFAYGSGSGNWQSEIGGLKNPAQGMQNLTWIKVQDFQPGDELHVTELHDVGFTDDYYHRTSEIIFRYLERIDFPDSIRYQIEQRKTDRIRLSPHGETEVINTHDTIIRTYKPWEYFDHNAMEPFVFGENLTYHSQKYYPDSGLMTKWIGFSEYEYDSWNECWTFPISHTPYWDTHYIEGLSGPYYTVEWNFSQWKRSLMFYKKGEETWGNPLTITHIYDDLAVHPKVNVFPNPAVGNLYIGLENIDSQAELQLTDVMGRVVLRKYLNETPTSINIEQLREGLYFYQIVISRTEKITGKVIIKR